MASDLQIVESDPSLPKELCAFFGKREGFNSNANIGLFLIVEKIDAEKASPYIWASGA